MPKGIVLVSLSIIVIIAAIFFVSNASKNGDFLRSAFKIDSVRNGGVSSGQGQSQVQSPENLPNYYTPQSSDGNVISDQDVPKGFNRSQLSVYFGKIKISVSRSYFATYSSSVTINSRLNSGDVANISGWSIKTNSGTVSIGKGVEFYESSGASSASDILLKNNQTAYVYFSKSPIGVNVRINKCLGYFNMESTVTKFPLSCPRPSYDEIAAMNLTSSCRNIINSLGSCQIPSSNTINSVDDQCRQFLSTLNYGGCVSRYRGDADFLSDEWRIWVGDTNIINSESDRVILYDKNGLVVDVYTY
jgi:hypothetical protein